MELTLQKLLETARRWTVPNLKHFKETRQPVVWLLAPLIGLATGAAAILFRLAIGAFQLPWLGTMTEAVAKAARAEPWWVIMIAPALGGLLVGLMLQFLLTAKRTAAVPDVMEARIDAGRSLTLGQGLLSAVASALSLGVGASAGREGPIVHLGASIAADVCNHLGLPNPVRRTLIASGAAGAVAASFNTPIAGVLFAQEVILGHFAVRSFIPLVLASVTATILSQAWFGNVAAFVVIALMFTLLVAKTAATSIALASRFGGGVFSPSLYLGALTGGAFGLIAAHVVPQFGSSEGLYAILGMGAVTAAVLGAPISTTVMVFELTGGFALSLALLLTVAIGNGISQAILGRSFFQSQLEARGIMLQAGPHQVLVKVVRVSDFMQPLVEGESSAQLEAEKELVLRPDDSLETALRLFDGSGAERVPVVDPAARGEILGWARQVDALACFNKELIATSVEEHG